MPSSYHTDISLPVAPSPVCIHIPLPVRVFVDHTETCTPASAPSCPSAPAGPVAPVAPVGPCGPSRLASHWLSVPTKPLSKAISYALFPSAPVGQVGPVGQVAPVAPVGPCGQVLPCGPCGQVSPVSHFSPCKPCGPCGPVAHVAPVSPLSHFEAISSQYVVFVGRFPVVSCLDTYVLPLYSTTEKGP